LWKAEVFRFAQHDTFGVPERRTRIESEYPGVWVTMASNRQWAKAQHHDGQPRPVDAHVAMSDRGENATTTFATTTLRDQHDVLAPDGSEIRVLVSTGRGSMAHGTLPPGGVSLAIVHRTVDEVWYVTTGRAQVWRKLGEREEVVEVGPGSALSIPLGAHFQFRTVGDEPFRFVMCTMPPWPGAHEAVRVPDYWPVGKSGDEPR
jgi:mannose-6-phosphate isomerase-like protein (cupin superfamily)